MNGRRAKALRKKAEAATVGMPTRRWTQRRGRQPVLGKPGYFHYFATIEHSINSTRGVYQMLKRQLRQERLPVCVNRQRRR